jgi:hypothetical protein
VQAGLFDRRSLIAARAHARSARVRGDAIDERAMIFSDSAATPSKRTAIIAVLLVPERQ